ncbi:hypothetical protein [Ancylobacter oerskovii]|uniref:Permease n=1 Tax=Ancylobacter oerskovii TaxID=459519 RepID=A0ABW4Z656_9HYPH|nr:hypothetical protein [Ancylobacter oerskovii]MBS7545504.1 hypothetical protein [Ancylobacter oerskovii]
MKKLKSLVSYLNNDRGVRLLVLGLVLVVGWRMAYPRIVDMLSPQQLDWCLRNEWFLWLTVCGPMVIGLLLMFSAPFFAEGPKEGNARGGQVTPN